MRKAVALAVILGLMITALLMQRGSYDRLPHLNVTALTRAIVADALRSRRYHPDGLH